MISQNLYHHLINRASGWHPRGQRHPSASQYLNYQREFYKSITPSLTVQNVDKPLVYLRKFTPDGQLLLGFSYDQCHLEVFKYQGVGYVMDLLLTQQGECVTASDSSLYSLHIRQCIFERMLKRVYCLRLVKQSGPFKSHINREFSAFFRDGTFVLLAAVSESYSSFDSFKRLVEYADLWDDIDHFNYTFFLVNLKTGIVSDKLIYNDDSLMLSHNRSVSVYEHTLAILSNCRQCIDLTQIDSNGKFKRLFTLGPFGSDLDRERILSTQQPSSCVYHISTESFDTLPLSHLKQKILSYMYRNIMETEDKSIRLKKLKDFYFNFSHVERMLISKMQLLDNNNIFMRYESRPTLLTEERSSADTLNKNKISFPLYVIYNISEQTILKIFPKNSVQLLYILRNFCDDFRNVRSLQNQLPSSSPNNNVYFRAAFDLAISSIPGGQLEAASRFNSTLPITSQSFSTSPYLDYSLFNYDDRLISAWERPKVNILTPICFRDRIANDIKFRLFLETSFKNEGQRATEDSGLRMSQRELVTFIFHPYEPFIISIQKVCRGYTINFHIYNKRSRFKVQIPYNIVYKI
ncbi:DET1 homolog isoform 1-T1 [Glossina fuscipes fuscipes]